VDGANGFGRLGSRTNESAGGSRSMKSPRRLSSRLNRTTAINRRTGPSGERGFRTVLLSAGQSHGTQPLSRLADTLAGPVKRTPALWLDLAVKLSLVALLAFGALSGLERFAGKAFGWRLVGYSIAALVVPAIWAARGRRQPYPFAADTLFVLPFLIDTVGNALDLYDTIGWWDDANHFVNWALLSGAVAVALHRTDVTRAELFFLVVGFGAVTAILWELGEYFAFIRNSPELETAYTDTLGDMTLGLSGATLTAAITVIALGKRGRERRSQLE
jgi:hypothetical protein